MSNALGTPPLAPGAVPVRPLGRPGRRRGFLLVEAMISSAVLGAVLSVGLDTIISMRKLQLRSENRLNAARATQVEMEKSRNRATGTLTSGALAPRPPGIGTISVSNLTETIWVGGSTAWRVPLTYSYRLVTVRVDRGSGPFTLSMVRAP